MQAARNGDEAKAAEYVEQAAKEWGAYCGKDGKPQVFYHGTPAKSFTVFKKDLIGSRFNFDEKGFFFHSLKSMADDYSHSEFDSKKQGTIFSTYLLTKKPFIFNKEYAIKNGYGNVFRDNDAIGIWDAYQGALLDEIEGKDYDSIIIDEGKYQMAVVFESNQIKSADPLTYDDYGEIIPLSERFGDSKDIRYSVKDTTDFKNALDDKEWAQFYKIAQRNNQQDGLRIGNDGIIIPQEKWDMCKLVYYYEDSDYQLHPLAIYRIANNDYTIHNKKHNPLKAIIRLEKEGYNEEFIDNTLRSFGYYDGYVFERYRGKKFKYIRAGKQLAKTAKRFREEAERRGIFAGDRKTPSGAKQLVYDTALTDTIREQEAELVKVCRTTRRQPAAEIVKEPPFWMKV